MFIASGLIAVFFSFFNNFDFPRIIFGHLFVYFFSGWNLSKVFVPKTNFLERFISSSLFSFLLTYPTSILITLIEGQSGQAIFSRHLHLSMSVLFLLAFIIPQVIKKILSKNYQINSVSSKPTLSPLLILALLTYSFFAFTNLNRADINGDEYDLGYQSYNLIDGILAGRKAYVISYNMHPPLTSSLKHFSLNLLEPSGFDYLKDWHFRFSEGLVGLLVITTSYALAKQLFNSQVAVTTALLLSVNNYLVFLGRIYHREMVLTFAILTTIYFLTKNVKNSKYSILLGIALGLALLTKATALILIPLIIITAISTKQIKKKQVFAISFVLITPVLIYNLLAYLTTGYADIFFSNLFGLDRPFSTPRTHTSPLFSLVSILTYLTDILSPLLMAIYLIASLCYSIKKSQPILLLWILTSLIFFSLTAARGYYFVFLAIPFTIILCSSINLVKNSRIRNSIVAFIITISALYTFNSNINRLDTRSNFPSDLDGSVLIPIALSQTKSQIVHNWTYKYGYKTLVAMLSKNLKTTDCITVDNTLDQLSIRRYLWINDPVKEHYLHTYPHRFQPCNSSESSGNFFNQKLISTQFEPSLSTFIVLTDVNNQPTFFVYNHSIK